MLEQSLEAMMDDAVGTEVSPKPRLRLPGSIKALVLLAGSFRANHLGASLGRSILNLPIIGPSSLLRQWGINAGVLAESLHSEMLPVRVLLDHLAPTLIADDMMPRTVSLQAERDRFDYRGSGGVLHDIAHEYQDDDLLLVANAASILFDNMAELVQSMGRDNSDVAIHAQPDGTPTGLMLVRCGCLRQISEVGFVDMKEQALPAVAKQHTVKVVSYPVRCFAVRSLNDYLGVLNYQVQAHADHLPTTTEGRNWEKIAVAHNPFSEDWQLQFSLVETGAEVHPTARVHNAVVLAGAKVGARAVVVRSVVGNGAVVSNGQMVVNQILGPGIDRR